MRTPKIVQRHPSLRWLAPTGVLGVVGLAAGGMIAAKASTSDPLPDISTTQLVADMQNASDKGFSGTVVTQVSLGLPQLPGLGQERDGALSFTSLLSGSHTMRVWYGGIDQQRVALLGQTSETDVFHSGSNVWEWDSDTHVATHTTLPADSHRSPSQTALTPQQLATRLLKSIDPTTATSLGAERTIADRSAYDLVLTPRDTSTRIGSVHIAVDGTTKVVLGVQVFARGSASPAVDLAYADITFKQPPSTYFSFVPPPGATVHTGSAEKDGSMLPQPSAQQPPKTVGSGWSTVIAYRTTATDTPNVAAGPAAKALTPVAGTWGRGELLDTTLFTALITSDGRVYAGAVDPGTLYAAASATH